MQKLHESNGIIHMSLDTDPNENVETVRQRQETNGFEWNFTVSSPDLTQQMIDEFGFEFVTAPSAPVVLVCPDQSYCLLERGVKTADRLRGEVEKC